MEQGGGADRDGRMKQKDGGGVRCGYREPWAPICRRERPCLSHEDLKCWCGEQAWRGCTIAVSLVCGAPLCLDHECIQWACDMGPEHAGYPSPALGADKAAVEAFLEGRKR